MFNSGIVYDLLFTGPLQESESQRSPVSLSDSETVADEDTRSTTSSNYDIIPSVFANASFNAMMDIRINRIVKLCDLSFSGSSINERFKQIRTVVDDSLSKINIPSTYDKSEYSNKLFKFENIKLILNENIDDSSDYVIKAKFQEILESLYDLNVEGF